MVGLFVMPSSMIFRQHTRLNAATNKTTKKISHTRRSPKDRNYPSIPFDKLPKTASVEATVTKNQKLVTLSTTVKDSLGYLPNCTAEQIPLIAKKTVPRSSAPKVFWNHFVNFVNEKL